MIKSISITKAHFSSHVAVAIEVLFFLKFGFSYTMQHNPFATKTRNKNLSAISYNTFTINPSLDSNNKILLYYH